MKVAIGYPPFENKDFPCLTQNRQFQWVKTPWTAYPMVSAYAATMAKDLGHDVYWLDGISEGISYAQWLSNLKKIKPDVLMIETKTPVVKNHWKIINEIKKALKISIVLVGDHVTALPSESFKNSSVDFILTGGDYDFLFINLLEHLSESAKLEPGIWYRRLSSVKNTGKFVLNHNLNDLPFIDRELTKWKLYAYKNSNYLRKPGTYTMFARDCWWGKCTFCSWTTLYPGKCFRAISPKRALDEIGDIIASTGAREIMDDSGSFPVGDWLREFCEGMIDRGYDKKMKISCNMRFNSNLGQDDYNLMAKAGFRFVLFGLESASQKTLVKINKNLKVRQIKETLIKAKKARLWPHVTVMIGYPWESMGEAKKTADFAKELFRVGLIDTLQATVVIPYPGTPLFEQCKKNGWLNTLDWDKYDMKRPIMRSDMTDGQIMGLTRGLYNSFWSPEFFFRKLGEGLTNWDKFQYYSSFALRYLSKLLEFK